MKAQVTRLDTGLRIASYAMPSLETAAIGVYVDVGSRFESEAEAGLSHLLEHMVFKGTSGRSARQIAEEIEAVGGHLNAYTTRDMTSFYARVMKEDIPLAVDLLADLVINARFDAREVEREREVVLQEIGQANDTPDDIVFDYLQACAFPDQPMGRSILGTINSLGHASSQTLKDWRAKHYVSGNIVITAAGRIEHRDIVDLASEKFAALPHGQASSPLPAKYQGGVRRDQRDLEQLHLTLALPGLSYHDEDIYALQLYSAILGGGMSSRLFQEVREERGLAYSIFSDVSAHAETGLMTIYAGTSPGDAAEALKIIAEQTRAMTDAIPEAELARARAQLKAGFFMALESAAAQSEQLGRHILMYGRALGADEIVAKIDAVDKAAVNRVAVKLLGGKMSLATVGPDAELGDIDDIAIRFGIQV